MDWIWTDGSFPLDCAKKLHIPLGSSSCFQRVPQPSIGSKVLVPRLPTIMIGNWKFWDKDSHFQDNASYLAPPSADKNHNLQGAISLSNSNYFHAICLLVYIRKVLPSTFEKKNCKRSSPRSQKVTCCLCSFLPPFPSLPSL